MKLAVALFMMTTFVHARAFSSRAMVAQRHVKIPAPNPLYVIGFVHGCLSELKQLLKNLDVSTDNIVLVGDLVNKGPSSAEVVQFCRLNKIKSVAGNHDMSALKHLKMFDTLAGSKKEKYKWTQQLSLEDVDYLESLPLSITLDGLSCSIVHAGVVPNSASIESNSEFDMTTIRLVTRDGLSAVSKQSAEKEKEKAVNWTEVYDGRFGKIIYGHDAKRGLQNKEKTVGLDTGCCYGGRLTAFEVWSGEICGVYAEKVWCEKSKKS
ncbi:hypothetical protein TL16_g00307 [Triparma laevis f. inornata]|uniref:Calcineurin-like phosphoesterase domain-containing protein n=1 Tax=Triparma laevis f. inornata TaxID=1714386 RepID=A0A9W7DND9_9STRA|nr:hypothetical protein TL16_g00307 [Triparma laevis f. inornata]